MYNTRVQQCGRWPTPSPPLPPPPRFVDALRRWNGASIQFPELCQARSEWVSKWERDVCHGTVRLFGW